MPSGPAHVVRADAAVRTGPGEPGQVDTRLGGEPTGERRDPGPMSRGRSRSRSRSMSRSRSRSDRGDRSSRLLDVVPGQRAVATGPPDRRRVDPELTREVDVGMP